MTTAFEEFTTEEVARHGNEIYERDIRPLVEAGNFGGVVAIDVRTGEYELADNALTSAAQLRARLPEAEIFIVRTDGPRKVRILSPRPNHPCQPSRRPLATRAS